MTFTDVNGMFTIVNVSSE